MPAGIPSGTSSQDISTDFSRNVQGLFYGFLSWLLQRFLLKFLHGFLPGLSVSLVVILTGILFGIASGSSSGVPSKDSYVIPSRIPSGCFAQGSFKDPSRNMFDTKRFLQDFLHGIHCGIPPKNLSRNPQSFPTRITLWVLLWNLSETALRFYSGISSV